MKQRIVIALGGNALGKNLPEQMAAVKKTAKAIVDLIQEGDEVVIAHGNGPQVGMIQNAMAELVRSDPDRYIPCPLSVCVAMSQGYIGYDLQNAIREEMLDRGIDLGVATVLTQVEVDPDDPAFQHPTKPIGSFLTKEEADQLVRERDYEVIEDAGRGYRRVVASPMPVSIIEIGTIRSLVETDHIVVACGGGGIPVFRTEGHHAAGRGQAADSDSGRESGHPFRQRRSEGSVGDELRGGGTVSRGRRVRAGLHAAEDRGGGPFRPVRPRTQSFDYPAGAGCGRDRGKNRHCHL